MSEAKILTQSTSEIVDNSIKYGISIGENLDKEQQTYDVNVKTSPKWKDAIILSKESATTSSSENREHFLDYYEKLSNIQQAGRTQAIDRFIKIIGLLFDVIGRTLISLAMVYFLNNYWRHYRFNNYYDIIITAIIIAPIASYFLGYKINLYQIIKSKLIG